MPPYPQGHGGESDVGGSTLAWGEDAQCLGCSWKKGQSLLQTKPGVVLPVFPFPLPSQSEGKHWQPDEARVASGSRWGIFQWRGGSEQRC